MGYRAPTNYIGCKMKLEGVLPSFREGKKIRRAGWPQNAIIRKEYRNGDIRQVEYTDFILDDWEVVEEPKKPMVFEGVVLAPTEFCKSSMCTHLIEFLLKLPLNKKYKVTVEELP